jgi:hypothetical protein
MLFVFYLVFSTFDVPEIYKHKVLSVFSKEPLESLAEWTLIEPQTDAKIATARKKIDLTSALQIVLSPVAITRLRSFLHHSKTPLLRHSNRFAILHYSNFYLTIA